MRKEIHLALASHNLGSVALGKGDLQRAADRYEAALSLYRGGSDRYGVALSELYLGIVAVEAGRYDDAGEFLARALPVFREMGFPQYAAQCVDGIASVLHARGRTVEAARLLGAAGSLREHTSDAPTVAARLRRRTVDATGADLGEPAFETAWAEGRALSGDEALDLAQRAVAG
jgi:tetratricopeptide (TPR) repeat protein